MAPCHGALDFAGYANQSVEDLVVQIAPNGEPHLGTGLDGSIEELAASAVVYRYAAGQEEFLAGADRRNVLRLDSSARSQFSVPTLSTLREALGHYATDNVRESSCIVFQEVWQDDNRLFFRLRPEEMMRRSMMQFLRNRLGADLDIWPEQNVDESHPVDIRLQPRLNSNRLLLLEIKWLGDSSTPDGRVTVRYRDARAQDGADQLAGYLDAQRQFAPRRVIHGYYVVIDGRRRRLAERTVEISRADGCHYENVELEFNPSHHEVREDFDPPYRMFARPVCSVEGCSGCRALVSGMS